MIAANSLVMLIEFFTELPPLSDCCGTSGWDELGYADDDVGREFLESCATSVFLKHMNCVSYSHPYESFPAYDTHIAK